MAHDDWAANEWRNRSVIWPSPLLCCMLCRPAALALPADLPEAPTASEDQPQAEAPAAEVGATQSAKASVEAVAQAASGEPINDAVPVQAAAQGPAQPIQQEQPTRAPEDADNVVPAAATVTAAAAAPSRARKASTRRQQADADAMPPAEHAPVEPVEAEQPAAVAPSADPAAPGRRSARRQQPDVAVAAQPSQPAKGKRKRGPAKQPAAPPQLRTTRRSAADEAVAAEDYALPAEQPQKQPKGKAGAAPPAAKKQAAREAAAAEAAPAPVANSAAGVLAAVQAALGCDNCKKGAASCSQCRLKAMPLLVSHDLDLNTTYYTMYIL